MTAVIQREARDASGEWQVALSTRAVDAGQPAAVIIDNRGTAASDDDDGTRERGWSYGAEVGAAWRAGLDGADEV
jgi:hypothetical protein